MQTYKHHISDHLSETATCRPLVDLAYRRIKELYLIVEGPLLADTKNIASNISMQGYPDDVEHALEQFFTLKDNFYHHAGCDALIAKYQARVKQTTEAGKRSGAARSKKAADHGE